MARRKYEYKYRSVPPDWHEIENHLRHIPNDAGRIEFLNSRLHDFNFAEGIPYYEGLDENSNLPPEWRAIITARNGTYDPFEVNEEWEVKHMEYGKRLYDDYTKMKQMILDLERGKGWKSIREKENNESISKGKVKFNHPSTLKETFLDPAKFQEALLKLQAVEPPVISKDNLYLLGERKKGAIAAWVEYIKSKGFIASSIPETVSRTP